MVERDLGALVGRLTAAIAEREQPILSAHGLTMWEYTILSALDREPELSQVTLAERSRRDPTRLIRHLDSLEERGLIARSVDRSDRRRHRVALTAEGYDAVGRCKRDIRAMESRLLSTLSDQHAEQLRGHLSTLVDALEDRDAAR